MVRRNSLSPSGGRASYKRIFIISEWSIGLVLPVSGANQNPLKTMIVHGLIAGATGTGKTKTLSR